MVQKLNLWVQVWYLCLAITLSVANAKTRVVDKRALLALRDLINNDQDLLAHWVATSDPCSDSWSGVSCNCSDLRAPLSAAACYTATAGRNDTVTQLDFGGFSSQMTGMLAPELGDLTYLQSLRLDGQSFQVNLLTTSAAPVHNVACIEYYANVWPCTGASYKPCRPYSLHILTASCLHAQLFTADTLLV